MRCLMGVLALVACLAAGCMVEGDAPPWRSPTTFAPGFLEEAVKDARGDNMQMGGTPTKRGALAPPSTEW